MPKTAKAKSLVKTDGIEHASPRPPVHMVERDVTVHDLDKHMDTKYFDEMGMAVAGDLGRIGHSKAWYESWGSPPKCPTCGAQAVIEMVKA